MQFFIGKLGLHDTRSDVVNDETSSGLNPWCPLVDACNADDNRNDHNTCQLCERRYLFIIASGRSGSTSLMHMIGKLPHIRMAGENNNALLGIKKLIDKIHSIKGYFKENDGAWQHHKITENSISCIAQYIMGTINPTLELDETTEDLLSQLSIDHFETNKDTILAFKTIRFVGSSWKKSEDEDHWNTPSEAVKFVKEHFPCARIVVNIRSDVSSLMTSRNSLGGFKITDSAELEKEKRDLLEVSRLFGEQAYLLDLKEWTDPVHGVDKINDLVKWLGYRDCHFKSLIHENNGGITKDRDTRKSINLGPNCRYSSVFDSAAPQQVKVQEDETKTAEVERTLRNKDLKNTASLLNVLEVPKYDSPPEVKFAICASVRNEAPYLTDWIEHHTSIGFDSFILYNDNSSDDTQCVIDAFSDNGLVDRIPEDVNKDFVDGVSIDHQGVVFEICRKHLRKKEQQSNTVWWVLTSDPDEFLWINRSSGAKTVKDVLQQLQSQRPDTLTIRVPNLVYGSSGHANYIQENPMKIFRHRFDVKKYEKELAKDPTEPRKMKANPKNIGYKNCNSDMVPLIKPYEIQPKAMTMVSAMAEYCGWERTHCLTPHCHSISVDKDSHLHDSFDDRVFYNRGDVQGYFAIAHYKVKSREEFYNRVCLSQYFDKLYVPYKAKNAEYPGCCSPQSYIDSLNNYMILFDDRMDEFESEISSNMDAISTHCNTILQESPCPKQMMEITGQEGILALKQWKDNLPTSKDDTSQGHLAKGNTAESEIKNDYRPLIFSAGFGTTATSSMFEATCDIGLCSLHWTLECCNRTILSYPEWYTKFGSQQQAVPFAGKLAHERAIKSFRVLSDCLLQDELPCPSVNLTFNSLRYHINNVISNKEIDVIHDSPYLEFANYVLKSAENLRGEKPIVLLSQIDPEEWAKNRTSKWQANNFCRFDFTDEDGTTPIGANLYMCLKTAISKGLGYSSIRDILISPIASTNIDDDKYSQEGIIQALSTSFKKYQEKMANEAVYSVNTFEQGHYLTGPEIGKQIKNALIQYPTYEANERSFSNQMPIEVYQWPIQPKRTCMSDYETAMVTGRHCDKLFFFLHFHKGGGTSMVDYLHKRELRSDFRINSDPSRFDDFQDGDDMTLAPWKNNLRLRSNVGSDTETRASSTEFWWSLYQKGLDFVNLEFNFLLPRDYFHVRSVLRSITVMRNPWDRFRSNYEQELSIRCRKCKLCSNLTMPCYDDNNLEDWMKHHKGILPEKRIVNWGGILHPNYHVRVLNGLADVPDLELDKSHLEMAKRVLDTFDAVLILEDTQESKMNKIRTFLGDDSIIDSSGNKKEGTQFPKLSNNLLKDDPLYKNVREIIDEYQVLFNKENKLDIELYEYAQTISLGHTL